MQQCLLQRGYCGWRSARGFKGRRNRDLIGAGQTLRQVARKLAKPALAPLFMGAQGGIFTGRGFVMVGRDRVPACMARRGHLQGKQRE